MVKNDNARLTFLYLLSFVALCGIGLAVGTIIFQMIDKDYTDRIFINSCLIVLAPLYFFLAYYIEKNLVKKEFRSEATRHWLIYTILFTSAIIVLVRLIIIVNILLNNGPWGVSILKTFTVSAICLLVFNFYMYDINRKIIKTPDRVMQTYGILILVITIGILIWSL